MPGGWRVTCKSLGTSWQVGFWKVTITYFTKEALTCRHDEAVVDPHR